MGDEINFIIDNAKEGMNNTVEHLKKALSKIRTGAANPSMLDGVFAEYYGARTPLNQLSSINAMDAKTLVIKPFDKGALEEIEKGIHGANLGLTPQNDGETILLNIPPLTEERRKEFVKKAKSDGEEAKVSIRNTRREAIDEIKKLEKESITEDLSKQATSKIDDTTKEFNTLVDKFLAAKETEIMKV